MAPNARDERIDTNDPQRHLVYAAEDSVLDDIDWIKAGMRTVLDVVEERIPAWASC